MIKIATDTIADLPAEVVKQHNIHIIPAWVYLKTGKVRTDTLDMHELFERLADEPDIPRTEPLSEEEYSEIFTGLIGRDDKLIVVSASCHVSRVYEIAGGAAKKVAPAQIIVHDSGGLSLWQGFQAIRASQMATTGYDGEAIIGALDRMRRQSQFFFVLDNLTYLLRGGRVNLAQYMLSMVFDLKPLLAVKEGQIVPVGRVRGRERGLVEMQLRLLESMRGILTVWLGVVHTNVPDAAQRITDTLNNTLRPAYSLLTPAGPTISTHAGPGAIGVVVSPCERGRTGELKLRGAAVDQPKS